MTTYAIGCTHFGHAKIIQKAGRPFGDVDEMDEVLIENWNKTVRPKDTVIHLGDFAFKGDPPETYLARLNGNIIRIWGNHDPKDWGERYYSFRHMRRRFHCFHFPIEEWDGWYSGTLHLHAHTHAKELVSAPRRFNVGADATGFRPISIDEILAMPEAAKDAGMK